MVEAWFKKWFNSQLYLDLYKHRDTNDAKKIISLISKNITLPKGSKVLDLACGSGRHSILFAGKGYNVLGIDLSGYLIKQAEKITKLKYPQYSERLKFEIKDMRDISHKNEFDLIVNLFSSFGYFDTDKENYRVVNGVSKALKKGGFFFFDFLNSQYLKKNLIPYDVKLRNHYGVIQVREINNGFVKKNIFFIKNNNKSSYPVINNFYEKIKLYSLKDFRIFFNKAGLKIIKVFGNYSGKNYNPSDSERLIILARKK